MFFINLKFLVFEVKKANKIELLSYTIFKCKIREKKEIECKTI